MNEQRTTMHITLKSVVRKVLTFVVVAASLQSASAQAGYTVLPGDTFARIARAHDVTLTELREANPGRSEALSPGDIVRIPQPMQLTRVMDSVASGSAQMHTVEAGQTLYSISKLHGISVEDLEAWNPSAAAGLSIGDQLVVGPGEEAVLAEATPASLGAPEEILGELPRLRQDTLRTLLMLPFLLEADTVEGGGYSAKTNRLREISLEFLHGAQWAAQLLSDSGYTVSLRVVDTEPDSLGVHLWTEGDLEWADVVLGPLRKAPLDSVNGLLRHSMVPQWVLTPQDPSVWEKHPLAFSMGAVHEPGMQALGALAAQQHDGDTVMMLETRGVDAALERAFREGFLAAATDSTHLQSVPANSQFADGLIAELDTSKVNPIALPAGKSAQSLYAYVQTELQLADSFPVHVYANSESREFEFLERRYLNRAHYTVPLHAQTKWNDEQVAGQIASFREAYATDPSMYALIAFDAVIESARWQGLPWPLPSQAHYQLDWQWDATRKRHINTYWSLETMHDGAWVPVD